MIRRDDKTQRGKALPMWRLGISDYAMGFLESGRFSEKPHIDAQ